MPKEKQRQQEWQNIGNFWRSVCEGSLCCFYVFEAFHNKTRKNTHFLNLEDSKKVLDNATLQPLGLLHNPVFAYIAANLKNAYILIELFHSGK